MQGITIRSSQIDGEEYVECDGFEITETGWVQATKNQRVVYAIQAGYVIDIKVKE